MLRKTVLWSATALLAGISSFAAGDKLKVKDLPPAVQKTVMEQTKGATLVGLAKEVEKGKTVFELETRKPNGQTRDLMIDSAGAVLSVEEEVALESIPAPAREAIGKSANGGKITRVELLTEGKDVSYEASIEKKGKKSSISVKADGSLVK